MYSASDKNMKTDFYCMDADNNAFIYPEMPHIKACMPNTAFHPATVSVKADGDECWVLAVSITHGCDVAREVYSSAIKVSHCPNEQQVLQLSNAWTICNRMTVYYKRKLFHKLFFSLVLRDPWTRKVFQDWIIKKQGSRHIIFPNLVASGPVATEVIKKE